ncbi:MAG: hypothetical protein AB7P20_11200 [Rhizobiaceae bacterium]
MQPEAFWSETEAERKARICQQEADRSSAFNDHMELVYTADMDEIFAELLRLDATAKDPRTTEILNRLFADRQRKRPRPTEPI